MEREAEKEGEVEEFFGESDDIIVVNEKFEKAGERKGGEEG